MTLTACGGGAVLPCWSAKWGSRPGQGSRDRSEQSSFRFSYLSGSDALFRVQRRAGSRQSRTIQRPPGSGTTAAFDRWGSPAGVSSVSRCDEQLGQSFGIMEVMFERFTDRARRVLVLAQEEARQFNYSFIGTEHLLLGLVEEGEGVGFRALDSFGVTLAAVRENLAAVDSAILAAAPAPFSPRAKKVLELSLREALQLGHPYIGTEHLLLGLIDETEGLGSRVLVHLGVDLERLRQAVFGILGSGGDGSRSPGAWQRASHLLDRDAVVRCSFCGRQPPDSGRLIAGQNAFICENCVHEWATNFSSSGGPASGAEAETMTFEEPAAGPDEGTGKSRGTPDFGPRG
jgi:hypothetical protein